MEKVRVLELFAGIGACSKALERLGIPHEIVDAVEIDKYAIASFNAVHGTNFEPQDITKWDKDIECDLIMHGSPCQDFSVAGKQAGGDEGSGTRSSLMYETLRIVEKLQPKYVIWENVKNLLGKKHKHNWEAYCQRMDELGYTSHGQVLNAKDYGIPQNRERVFTVSIRNDVYKGFQFPAKMELTKRLGDVLESEVDEKYYLSERQLHGMSVTNYESYKLENLLKPKDGLAATLKARFEGCPQLVETPFVVASRGRNPENPSDRTKGAPTVQRLEPKFDGTTNTITSVQKDNYVVVDDIYKNRPPRVYDKTSPTLRAHHAGDLKVVNLKTKLCNELVEKGVVHGGEVINHSYTNSEQRDTLDKYIETDNGVMPTVTTRPDTLGYVEPNPVRIRKLTPKECWRLMGFDDEDFEKAAKVNSNAQLYKQAGNSIVVNVLEEILKELLWNSR
jgi:DNA (cytosine-5)-methyltransferase 1